LQLDRVLGRLPLLTYVMGDDAAQVAHALTAPWGSLGNDASAAVTCSGIGMLSADAGAWTPIKDAASRPLTRAMRARFMRSTVTSATPGSQIRGLPHT